MSVHAGSSTGNCQQAASIVRGWHGRQNPTVSFAAPPTGLGDYEMTKTTRRRQQRLRKTKLQLIDELEQLERRLADDNGVRLAHHRETAGHHLLLEAIEHLDEGVALFDADNRLVLCNKNYLSAFAPELEGSFVPGTGFEELVAIATERNYFATDDRSPEEVIRQRLKTHQDEQTRHEMRLASGDWVSFRSYKTPDGGTILFRFNITELKRKEEELRQIDERYRFFVNSANDAIISIDGNARVVKWNRGAEQIFGYTEAEMLGRNLERLMPEDLYKQHVGGVERASRDGKHKYSDSPVEIRGLRKDGTEFPLELSLSSWEIDGSHYFGGIIRDISEKKLAAEALQAANEDTERLLLRVLPADIVRRMNEGEETIADRFDEATVLFSDLVGFTQISANLSPKQLVDNLNGLFSRFDTLADDLGVEKVKTIGDAYMAVAGVPEPRPDHTRAMADMALGMIAAVEDVNTRIDPKFQMRIGIQTGPVVAGIIGRHRFLYDIWGDTVNMASRFESYSEPGRIHVSAELASSLEADFVLHSRGILDIRGKGKVETYFLDGRK